MSLLKNPWFWVVAGIIATISAYMICSVSVVGFLFFYIMSPAAFGFAVRTYLDRIKFTDEWLADERQFYTEEPACGPRISLAL